MVFGVIDALVAFSQSLLANIYPVPGILSGPVVSNLYIDLFFVGLFIFVLFISRFLRITRLFIAMGVMFVFSVLVGGIYFTVIVFAVQIPMIVVWKFFLFRKKGDKLDKDMDFGDKKGSKDELGLDDLGKDISGDTDELDKDFKSDEGLGGFESGQTESSDFGETPKQKLCPYCRNPLRYFQQYQRYWCDYCKQYR